MRLATLAPLHRDPIDRLLVAQALVEGLARIAADYFISQYPVRIVR